MRTEHKTRTALIGLAMAASLGACTDEFAPYNEIAGFRLLAIAADRPALLPGESAELSALLTVADSEATFSWSWCPLVAGPDQGYRCAVTREEMQTAADAALGPGVLEVPPLELGNEPTATFAYDALTPEFLRAVCELLHTGEIPNLVELPECEGSFPMTVQLEVGAAGESISGVKAIELLYEEGSDPPNQNPFIAEAWAIHPAEPEVEIEIASDGSTALAREVEYTLRLEIPNAVAESYSEIPRTGGSATTRREDLIITWFVEAGETEVMRTAFLDGEIALDQASENQWSTPSSSDSEPETTRLYFVIRDNRGGTSWLYRSLRLED